MNDTAKTYIVGDLAIIAGITVRTLRYYDRIGLLHPTERTAAGYRVYHHTDLLRLQQILFYRELEFPLEDIRRILDTDGFNVADALECHREMLLKRKKRTETLISTIDNTIATLKGERMLTDEELYEGFTKEEIQQLKEYEDEAKQKYDPQIIAESQRRVRSMTKEQLRQVRKEGEDINHLLASLINEDPSSPTVQEAIRKHYQNLHQYYTPNLEMYRGLGELYVSDSRFRAYYDAYAPGLADFIKQAIEVFCEKQ